MNCMRIETRQETSANFPGENMTHLTSTKTGHKKEINYFG